MYYSSITKYIILLAEYIRNSTHCQVNNLQKKNHKFFCFQLVLIDHVYTLIYTCVYTCIYASVYIQMYVRACACACVCAYMCITCLFVYRCVCVCVRECVFVDCDENDITVYISQCTS